ncbi:MAG: hypothetical protein H0T76_21025 [Nannocystis sp.]|nr:hypothetical protein [Nannocystis sp.]MBA3548973.1 hypothetical protein [Nannocystis sp.]
MLSRPLLAARFTLFTGLACAGILACTADPTPPAEPAKSIEAEESAAAVAPKAGSDAWSFDFKEPGPGPRAPRSTAFNATVGASMFPEVEALVQQRGLECANTSVRAMMDRRREAETAKIADAKARGEDAVTAASWVNKRSKREANPQLRFSCPKITSDQIGDRTRPPSSGRLLYVFDDESYPLRHSSYQRTHKDHAAALIDFQDAVAALTAIYGPPGKTPKTDLPQPDKDGKVEFPNATNFEIAWDFADLAVRINVLRYGDLVTVGERIEVPHGIRPDAPKLPGGAAANAATSTPTPAAATTVTAPATAVTTAPTTAAPTTAPTTAPTAAAGK